MFVCSRHGPTPSTTTAVAGASDWQKILRTSQAAAAQLRVVEKIAGAQSRSIGVMDVEALLIEKARRRRRHCGGTLCHRTHECAKPDAGRSDGRLHYADSLRGFVRQGSHLVTSGRWLPLCKCIERDRLCEHVFD